MILFDNYLISWIFLFFHYITLHLKYKKLSFISWLNWNSILGLSCSFILWLNCTSISRLLNTSIHNLILLLIHDWNELLFEDWCIFLFLIKMYFYFILPLIIVLYFYFTIVATSIHNWFIDDVTGKWVNMLINMRYILSLYQKLCTHYHFWAQQH